MPIPVLLVDDDPLQVELLARALTYEGIELEGISSLLEVGVRLGTGRARIVLLDASVLGPDPRASVRAIRGLAPPGTRLVLLSAADEAKLRRISLDCGTDGWLSKSWPIPDIAKRLRDMFENPAG